LSKEGGIMFMVLGNEALGKDYSFTKRTLQLKFIIRELLPSTISYQFYLITKRMKLFIRK